MQADVIIIGAGAAGLAAAENLSAEGLKTVILEARERVGGRIYTLRDAGFPVELGAEFVHGKPQETLIIARSANLNLNKVNGTSWQIDDKGEIVKNNNFASSNENKIWQGLEKFSGVDISFAKFLQRNFGAPEFEQARRSAALYIEGFHAAKLTDVSTLSLQRTENAIGDEDFRFPQGYDQLIRWLHDRAAENRAEFRLSERVKTIRWNRRGVEIEVENQSEVYSARCTVFTLPLGVWQAGKIRFEPALPEKEQALQKMKMGAAVRISFRFKRKWWKEILRSKSSENLGFLFSRDADIPVWWTSEPIEANILTGWAGGTKAEQLCRKGTDFITFTATEALSRVFKINRAFVENEIENVFTYDWQRDELAMGSYSYILKGGLIAPEVLAKPVGNTLFFAGEATNSEGHWATVHGAIATGRRAAQQVLKLSNT